MLTIVMKAMSSMAMSLMSEKLVTELTIWAIGKLVKSTKNGWDDELYKMAVEKMSPKKE